MALLVVMARQPRFQYPGAIYHVMARGDGGKVVFETEDDRRVFVFRLGQVGGSHGWRVHAWVLMGNHFHLLLETPEANLVSGMKYLMGTFSQGWNRARQRRGHVFQGRYKAVPVTGADADAYYFRTVADYIHLNPARAGLAGGVRRALVSYKWSSLPSYVKGNGPDWLVMDRVLRAFDLEQEGRGRRAYVAWLEARAANHDGKIDQAAMQALRQGWYLGKETFKEHLLKLLDQATSKAPSGRSLAGGAMREHGEREAIRLVHEGLKALGSPSGKSALAALGKGDPRKIVLAGLLREKTSVSNHWITGRLAMGHPGSVSRLLCTMRSDRNLAIQKNRLIKILYPNEPSPR
jgi:REP element-mobilizing transposase RayT